MKSKLPISPKVFLATIIMMMNLRRALSFSFSRRICSARNQRQGVINLTIKKSFLSSTPEANAGSKSEPSSRQTEQDGFITQMKDWRGTSRSTSEFVTHFIASDSNITIEEAVLSVLPIENGIENGMESPESIKRKAEVLGREDEKVLGRLETNFRNDPSQFPLNQQLNPVDLIAMGSVWFLPAEAPRDPALGLKPIRLEAKNLTSIMAEGDYLRVHHMPRRFPEVHDFDWGKELNEQSQGDNKLPGVIVHEDTDKGYIVLNKPAGVPVHPTVDNVLENVAGAVGRSIVTAQRSRLEEAVENMNMDGNATVANDFNQTLTWHRNGAGKRINKQKESPLLYVVAPQRLDQNTSGLFVVATKKIFAGYFAKLLRTKTGAYLKASKLTESSSASTTNLGNIQKKYTCLVCIQPNKRSSQEEFPPSVWDEVGRLQSIVKSNELVRHYLEPTKRAPRTYSENYNEDWLECLMKIIDVGDAMPVVGSTAADELCTSLWGMKENKPLECTAVVQVEVELLTGRSHQIRGQLSTLGFSLCGDAMYGGTSPTNPKSDVETSSLRQGHVDGYMNSEKLALQCCELQFLDPDYVENKRGGEEAIRSNRVNKFRLQKSWWTLHLDRYELEALDNPLNTVTTSKADLQVAKEMKESEANESMATELGQIQRIQLSPGQHKYVIVKATHPSLERPEWFVKTASPDECGGLFHADVARGLVNELNTAGFDTVVLGGGRIDYDSTKNHARVYGFSYGFGKGDHAFASLLIEQEGINSSFDDSDALY